MKQRLFFIPAQFKHAPLATVFGILVQIMMWGSFIMAHVMIVCAMSDPHAFWWSPVCLVITAVAFLLWNYAVRPLARAEIRRYFKKQENRKN